MISVSSVNSPLLPGDSTVTSRITPSLRLLVRQEVDREYLVSVLEHRLACKMGNPRFCFYSVLFQYL